MVGFWIHFSRRTDFEGERERKESEMTLKFGLSSKKCGS